MPLPKFIILLEDTHLMTIDNRTVLRAKDTRLEVCETVLRDIVMKDSTETFYSIPKASSIRFTAIPTAKSCFLSEFKHTYEMPKIVRFIDYETYNFVYSDQAGEDILADMLAGPVRILDELELEVLITWVLDKKERNMVQCIMIPESKIGDILAKPFDTKHGTCHIATKQLNTAVITPC